MKDGFLPDILLAGVCLLLIGVLAREALAPRGRVMPPPGGAMSAAAPGAARPDPATALPPLTRLASFVDRPLFWASRRPRRAAMAGAAPAVGLALSGVVIAASDRFAILAPADGKPLLRARVGQVADGWRVTEVHADRVVLRHAGQEVVLRPGARTPTAAPSGALPPGGAGPTGLPRPPIPAPFDHLWYKDTRWGPR